MLPAVREPNTFAAFVDARTGPLAAKVSCGKGSREVRDLPRPNPSRDHCRRWLWGRSADGPGDEYALSCGHFELRPLKLMRARPIRNPIATLT
jgi:hypothetical protein